MKLSNLPKVKAKSNKIVGRGIGSGKGKTAGRGSKGQKARGTIPASFVGGSLPLYKKLPFKRGWGNRKVSQKPVVIKTSQLEVLKPNTVVNIASLIENNIISEKASKVGVKVLAGGEIKVALTIKLPISKQAKTIIEQAGGEVVS